MIDLSNDERQIIDHILLQHVPECEVRAFGSRVKGTAKVYSDLDLVVVGPTRLERRRLNQLQEAFALSLLPFRVEVLDWHALADSFQKIITEKYEVLQTQPKN